MCKSCSSTRIMQEISLFSGKIYTAGTNFTRPPVVTVATNLNSGHQIEDHRVCLLQVCRGNSILKASLKIANTCLQCLRVLPTMRRTMHRKPPFCTDFGPEMPKLWFSFIQSITMKIFGCKFSSFGALL